jgi:Hyccin
LYLNAVATGEKQIYRCVETLILCAYNIEVCNQNGILKSISFRMPVLAQASIYHEEKNLHASDLKVCLKYNHKNYTLLSFFIDSDGRKIVTKKLLGILWSKAQKSLLKIVKLLCLHYYLYLISN